MLKKVEKKVDLTWEEQKGCALRLLKSRIILRKMVEMKMYRERVARGNLTAIEVHKLIQSQSEGDGTDFVAEITELKKNLMTGIRQNHQLEKQSSELDKRIGLLIKNVENVAVVIPRSRRRQQLAASAAKGTVLTQAKMQAYSNLFYLLQTEPEYLAMLVNNIYDPETISITLDTILLTLYGDAYSPREEFLILTLFKLSINNAIKDAIEPSDVLKEQSVLVNMVITYNKRKQGLEYISQTLGPVITEISHIKDSMDMNGRKIHQNLISEEESTTGEKSKERAFTDDDIEKSPKVVAVLDARIKALTRACQLCLDKIIGSVRSLPYGLRWICKQQCITVAQSLSAKDVDLRRIVAYFVYYRFIGLAIVSPDKFGIADNLSPVAMFNLIEVSKVLQHLFTFMPFSGKSDRWYAPMNKWIEKSTKTVIKYIETLIDVDDPEDVLQIDRYMELTQMVKPTIIIDLDEITNMHILLKKYLGRLAIHGDKDKLRIIMNDLGDPEVYDDSEREIQLTLSNRFADEVEDGVDEGMRLFNETKSAIISIMRKMPTPLPGIDYEESDITLKLLLDAGTKWAVSEKKKDIAEDIADIYEDLKKLEKMKLVDSKDGHRDLLREVTLEIANREQIREHQKKELARLRLALIKTSEQKKYLEEQIEQYNQYLHVVRERHVGAGPKKKRGKNTDTNILGPFKYSYPELVKKKVIVESVIPKGIQKATKISITSEEPGIFDIEVAVPGVTEKVQLSLDDFLEKQSMGQEHDDLQNIVLDVNMTIFLLNGLLRKKK